jgi:hypothetical protein
MWIDGDRAHPRDSEFYERLLDQAVAWGVEVFEHDWLIECFLVVRGLRAPGRAAAWQEGIDAGLGARDLHAQWCMASPADFAQTSRLRNITSIRTSGDHGYLVGPEVLWAWFLHTNVMARALGLWPYKDVFHSAIGSEPREVEALLSALSAGPVGVGDPIGQADVALIRRTCRADGVLVRPDVPIAATDAAMFDAPVWSGAALVGSAHTRHSAGLWGYVLTCNVGMDKAACASRVTLEAIGEDRPATDTIVVYDWRTRQATVLPATGGYDIALEPAGWDYRVLAPMLPGGIAVIGDPALYACAGDARIADVVSDDDVGGVTVTVLGANERMHVVGYCESPITARAWTPSGGANVVHHDTTGSLWDVELAIGDAGWVKLHIGIA